MLEGRGQLYRTVFDINCCMLVGLSFSRPKVFEIRHLATVISVKEGSLDLEKITTVNDLRIQQCLNKEHIVWNYVVLLSLLKRKKRSGLVTMIHCFS